MLHGRPVNGDNCYSTLVTSDEIKPLILLDHPVCLFVFIMRHKSKFLWEISKVLNTGIHLI